MKTERFVTLAHCENTTRLTFYDGGCIHATEDELRQKPGYSTMHIDDGGHQMICRVNQMVLLDMPDVLHEGEHSRPVHSYECYVPRFFEVVLHLRKLFMEKKQAWIKGGGKDYLFQPPVDRVCLDSFHFPRCPRPCLTVMQIVHHANVEPDSRLQFIATLREFMQALPREQKPRLLATLSSYVPHARFYASRGEFYFDGRNMPDGVGFNGGIILRDGAFSVHT
jgi:hypothetical protein